MPHIVIISASVRTGRKSHRVALYFKNYLESNNIASAEILDLKEYNFPIFDERLKYQANPLPKTLEFAEKVSKANGVIIVTPEYNGGYPASLKNVVDLLTDDWKHKPVAISTVSGGPFAGSQVITSLQFSLWKIKAYVAPAMFPVPGIDEAYDEQGVPADKEATAKRAKAFVDELLHIIEREK